MGCSRRNFGTQCLTYNGRTFDANNELLGTVRGVGGLKTGNFRASGFNRVATVNRVHHRLIVVVGCNGKKARDAEVTALIKAIS